MSAYIRNLKETKDSLTMVQKEDHLLSLGIHYFL